MSLTQLPNGHTVIVDTETSNLYPDSGQFVSVVSFAYRRPDDGQLVAKALPFDQGPMQPDLTSGDPWANNALAKELDARTFKRISKWPQWALDDNAPNLHSKHFIGLITELLRFKLVFHNAKFDMLAIRNGLRSTSGLDLEGAFYHDTQLAQHVEEPQMPTALKLTAVRLELADGGEDEAQKALDPWLGPKQGKNADPRYDLVPWSVMSPYATEDALLTHLLYDYQVENGYSKGNWDHVLREFNLMLTLYRMEQRGLPFDATGMRENSKLLEVERKRLAEIIPFKGGTDGPTPASARRFFFTDAERPPFKDKITKPSKTFPQGQAQVDDEVIERLVKAKVPFASEYAAHEGAKSAYSKWYGAWPNLAGKDGRLRTCHRQGRVVSGRLSVERVQLHAIPHDARMPQVPGLIPVREFFPSPPGYELWEFDISQAEIRIATAVARCQPMLDGIEAGDDSHSIATRLMFADQFAGYEGREEEHPKWDEFRQVAKRCNLGILYGIGAGGLRDQIAKFTGIVYPMTKVRGFRDQWLEAFPEFAVALERTQERAERQGFVRLYNGRIRWFDEHEPSHKAFNQYVQGSLAETMKDVMCEVEDTYPDSLLLQIHDSLVMQIPESDVPTWTKEIPELISLRFEQAFTDSWHGPSRSPVTVPFKSDAKRFGRYTKEK